MNLFIFPLEPKITLTCIKGERIVEVRHVEPGKDFEDFGESIIRIMQDFSIDNIWCVAGPGAFTRMRIITLTINTLILTKKINVKCCHFFDIIPPGHGIPLLGINEREAIIQRENIPVIIAREDIPNGTYIGYDTTNNFTDTKKYIQFTLDIPYLCDVFTTLPSVSHIDPIYLKSPHITTSGSKIPK